MTMSNDKDATYEKYRFIRSTDGAECTICSDMVHWLTDKHDALQVTVLVIWSRESRKILIQRFLDNGAMPPGYIALTAIVKENYAYKISSNGFIYYILVGITFYDDTGKQIHMETFVDNDLTLVRDCDPAATIFFHAREFLMKKASSHINNLKSKTDYDEYDDEWYRGENSFVDDVDDDDRRYWAEVEEDDA